MQRLPTALAGASVVFVLGCAGISFPGSEPKLRIKPPNIEVAAVRLAEAPTNRKLASYYCAQYVGPLICRALGPVASISDLQFAFDVELEFENPNPVPMPVVQALFGFTAFPEKPDTQNLGSVCLSFCEDTTQCEQAADACTSDEPEIRDAQDFAEAAAGFLIATALGQRDFSDLRVRTIPPNDRTRIVVRLGLDPLKMVNLIKTLAKDDIARVKRAEVPEFSIPYNIEGSAWVSVESFGRLARGFGPVAGSWQLSR